jgi:hypothetical protein
MFLILLCINIGPKEKDVCLTSFNIVFTLALWWQLKLCMFLEIWSKLRISLFSYNVFLNSTQDCFKASWSSHKSVHLKAKLSSLGTGTPLEQNSGLLDEGWLYCLKKGQARTPKLPHFDWTGYFSMTTFASYST